MLTRVRGNALAVLRSRAVSARPVLPMASQHRLVAMRKLTTNRVLLQEQKQDKSTSAVVDENLSFTDEEVDEWLKDIEELKTEFSEREFLPEVSLAPPGQARIDLVEEAIKSSQEFEPSQEQLEEWEALKDQPMPQLKDPTVQHVTNMIMRHGKKDRAQKIISRALYFLHCKTRKDPVELLKKALDDMAPLIMVKTFNTGVAKAAVIPVPLSQRQRNRIAWKWIVEGANKRVSNDFAVRLGEELVAVYEGKSSGFEKRDQMHKTAIAHRSYIQLR